MWSGETFFQECFSREVTQICLIAPAVSFDNMCKVLYGQEHISDSVPRVPSAAGNVGTLCSRFQHFRFQEGKPVVSISLIVCTVLA